VYVEEEKQQRIPDLRGWKGDGLIVNFDDRAVAQSVRGLRKPIVGLGGGGGWYDPSSGIPYVDTDNEAIGRLAAEHLLERGLRHFAFCGYPPTRTHVWIEGRARGFRERLRVAGFDCPVFRGRHSTAHRWAKVLAELRAWLSTLPRPIGIMGCYDWRARQLLLACAVPGPARARRCRRHRGRQRYGVRPGRPAADQRFRKHLGPPVDREIRRVRLQRAQELLTRTDLPLRTVAREAGYASEQYLSAVICAACRCTPSHYRTTHRGTYRIS
jgi:hypothetical protein